MGIQIIPGLVWAPGIIFSVAFQYCFFFPTILLVFSHTCNDQPSAADSGGNPLQIFNVYSVQLSLLSYSDLQILTTLASLNPKFCSTHGDHWTLFAFHSLCCGPETLQINTHPHPGKEMKNKWDIQNMQQDNLNSTISIIA